MPRLKSLKIILAQHALLGSLYEQRDQREGGHDKSSVKIQPISYELAFVYGLKRIIGQISEFS